MTQSSTSQTSKASKRSKVTETKKVTKAATVLKLLDTKQGATIDALSKATGWRPHSVRGFLSGTVKKRMGLNLVSEAGKDGVRRYRVDQTATKAAEPANA